PTSGAHPSRPIPTRRSSDLIVKHRERFREQRRRTPEHVGHIRATRVTPAQRDEATDRDEQRQRREEPRKRRRDQHERARLTRREDRKSTRLNSSHGSISYAV